MHRRSHKLLVAVLVLGWAGVVGGGLSRLWAYERAAGDAGNPSPVWPAGGVTRAPALPTLVLMIHPRCPCSRATIGELSKIMARCQGKLSAIVLMARPAGEADGWARTDLWHSAAAIPGVSVLADDGGIQSARFGAATSGQALLYAPDGQLLFAGGITESRGHAGDNAGASAVVALVLKQHLLAPDAAPAHAAVYGCPLPLSDAVCRTGDDTGAPPCRK